MNYILAYRDREADSDIQVVVGSQQDILYIISTELTYGFLEFANMTDFIIQAQTGPEELLVPEYSFTIATINGKRLFTW